MGAWTSFPWKYGHSGKRKQSATADEDQPLLLTIDVNDGPKAAQRILDDALRCAVMGLKFLCAGELRCKGASRAQLSEAQMERLLEAVLRLLDSPAVPTATKAFVLDSDVLTNVLAPPSLEMAARYLTVAMVAHIYGSTNKMSSFYAFVRENNILATPFARCAHLGGVHTIALLEIAGWYPSGKPSHVAQRESPNIHRQLVEEKRRLIAALLDVGADVNAEGGKAFACASSLAGHDIVLEELLRDPDAVDGNALSFREALQRFLTSDAQGDNARVVALFSRATRTST